MKQAKFNEIYFWENHENQTEQRRKVRDSGLGHLSYRTQGDCSSEALENHN
jgi:hypothetical protein